jgi:tetratricopeptide (TPR) repeat protein
VVDTGSIDDTVAIAQRAGAKVFTFPWCDDFSAARNESLGHASGDWILWIDGDDELQQRSPDTLRQLCAQLPADADGLWLEVRSAIDRDLDSRWVTRQWRVFRNHAGIRFQGRIHEQATLPRGEPKVILQEYISLRHWGYAAGEEAFRKKDERNTRLLLLSIAEEPDNPLHYYNLGRQRNFQGRPDLALMVFEQGIDHWFRNPSEAWTAVGALFSATAAAAVDCGQYERALAVEQRTPDRYVTADLLYYAGAAHWAQGRPFEAVPRLERAASDASTIDQRLHDRATSTWLPRLALSEIFLQLGDAGQAYQLALQAHESNGTHAGVLHCLAMSAAALPDRGEEAVRWAREALAGGPDARREAQLRRLLLIEAGEQRDAALAIEALAGPVEGVDDEDATRIRAAAEAELGQ